MKQEERWPRDAIVAMSWHGSLQTLFLCAEGAVASGRAARPPVFLLRRSFPERERVAGALVHDPGRLMRKGLNQYMTDFLI